MLLCFALVSNAHTLDNNIMSAWAQPEKWMQFSRNGT